MKNLNSIDMHFEMAKPFRPYEQLLAVLPRESAWALPSAYQVNFSNFSDFFLLFLVVDVGT